MIAIASTVIKNQSYDIVKRNGKYYISASIEKIMSVGSEIDIITGEKEQYFDLHNLIGCAYKELDKTVYTLLLEAYAGLRAQQINQEQLSAYDKMKKECFGVG